MLWDNGVYIMNRFEEGFTINLHSLFDFYVEVRYNRATNKIDKLRTFINIDPLGPYLNRIKLNMD